MLKLSKKNRGAILSMDSLFNFGIILFAVVAIIGLASLISNKMKSNDEVTNTSMIASAVRQIYVSDSGFNGVSEEIVRKSGFVKKSMVRGNKIVNSFGDPIVIQAETLNGIADSGFSISSKKYPESVCVTLVNTVRVEADSVDVGGAKITNASKGAEVTNACSGGNKAIKIVFQ